MTVVPFLFNTDPNMVAATCDRSRPALQQVGAVVVDWEREGKARRQARAKQRIGVDTQVSTDTAPDLARVRAAVRLPVICRINNGLTTSDDIEAAVRLGADEVLLPMVRSSAEVEAVLRQAGDRIGVGVMLETADALRQAELIGRLPITRAYVGLMDLALDRGTSDIFAPLLDGSLERARAAIEAPFGFGGLTIPGRGFPLPTSLLLGEMARLGCAYTFLRRSFLADVADAGLDPGEAVAMIRRAAERAACRPEPVIEAERNHLVEHLHRIVASAGATR